MAIERRNLLKGLLAAAGALLPKPLLAQVPEWSGVRIVRTLQFNEPTVEPPAYVMVTERWTREGEHSFRIEDGPWIPMPSLEWPWVLCDSPISSVHRIDWMEPREARLMAAQTSAPLWCQQPEPVRTLAGDREH